MKLLAIETSSVACSIALQIDDKAHAIHEIMPMQQTQHVLRFIEQLLHAEHLKIRELDAIVFGQGPGSFTGTRIAASIAQGLAYAIECPVIPISSLAALAQNAFIEWGWPKLLVAVDARMKEVYWGTYEATENGLMTLAGTEKLSKPEAINSFYPADFKGVGDAWVAYGDKIACKPLNIDAHALPTAAGALALAVPRYLKKQWLTPFEAAPVYLRNDI